MGGAADGVKVLMNLLGEDGRTAEAAEKLHALRSSSGLQTMLKNPPQKPASKADSKPRF
jgi:transketolase